MKGIHLKSIYLGKKMYCIPRNDAVSSSVQCFRPVHDHNFMSNIKSRKSCGDRLHFCTQCNTALTAPQELELQRVKMLTVYLALAGSHSAGKENVCLSNAYAHNVSIFREIQCINFQSDSPSKGAGNVCLALNQGSLFQLSRPKLQRQLKVVVRTPQGPCLSFLKLMKTTQDSAGYGSVKYMSGWLITSVNSTEALLK